MDIEKLDLNNVIEVDRIKKKLESDKKLLEFFLLLIDVANNLNFQITSRMKIRIRESLHLRFH